MKVFEELEKRFSEIEAEISRINKFLSQQSVQEEHKPNKNTQSERLNQKNAAQTLGISPATLGRYIDKGLIKAHKQGRQVFITLEELERFKQLDFEISYKAEHKLADMRG